MTLVANPALRPGHPARLHVPWILVALAVGALQLRGLPAVAAAPAGTGWRDVAGSYATTGADFETAWNRMLVRWLDARRTGAPDTSGLRDTLARMAAAEPAGSGAPIASEALQRSLSWTEVALADRILAQADEDTGWAKRADPAAPADSLLRSALLR